MTDEKDGAVQVIEAHQELVSHLEKGSGRMRALSLVTIVVALYFTVAYVSQLLVTVLGTKTVTVDLTDPTLQITEVVALVLAIAWLYVGTSDFIFSTRMRKAVKGARKSERQVEERLPTGSSE